MAYDLPPEFSVHELFTDLISKKLTDTLLVRVLWHLARWHCGLQAVKSWHRDQAAGIVATI